MTIEFTESELLTYAKGSFSFGESYEGNILFRYEFNVCATRIYICGNCLDGIVTVHLNREERKWITFFIRS